MNRWLSAVAALASIAGLAALSGGASPAQAHSYRDAELRVSGTPLRDLLPGVSRRVEVTFTNPNRFPIQVSSVRGELIGTSARGCRAARTNLEIRPYRGRLPLTVPARSRRGGGAIEAYMPASVSPACQNVSFVIRLTGTATKAGR